MMHEISPQLNRRQILKGASAVLSLALLPTAIVIRNTPADALTEKVSLKDPSNALLDIENTTEEALTGEATPQDTSITLLTGSSEEFSVVAESPEIQGGIGLGQLFEDSMLARNLEAKRVQDMKILPVVQDTLKSLVAAIKDDVIAPFTGTKVSDINTSYGDKRFSLSGSTSDTLVVTLFTSSGGTKTVITLGDIIEITGHDPLLIQSPQATYSSPMDYSEPKDMKSEYEAEAENQGPTSDFLYPEIDMATPVGGSQLTIVGGVLELGGMYSTAIDTLGEFIREYSKKPYETIVNPFIAIPQNPNPQQMK